MAHLLSSPRPYRPASLRLSAPGGDNWTGDAVVTLVGEPELELAAMKRGSEVATPEKFVEAFRRSGGA